MPSDPRSRLSALHLLVAIATALLLIPATAASAANPEAHIIIEGTGSGEVLGVPPLGGNPTIECKYSSPGPTTGVCDVESSKPEGFAGVLVEHQAAPGSEFAGWKVEEGFEQGCGSGECGVITFGEEIIIIATFECETEGGCGGEEFPLTIEVEGEGEVGGGGITCTEAGNGGAECEEEFPEGSEPGLTATPESGWHFAGWTTEEGNAGSCEGETTPCEAGPLTEPTKLKATFAENAPPVTVEFAGEGSGTVEGEGELSGNPPLECHWNGETETSSPEPCEVEAIEGEFTGILAAAYADAGSEFNGWEVIEGDFPVGCEEKGEAAADGEACGVVTFGNPIVLKATFDPIPRTLTVEPTGEGSVDAEEPPTPLSGEISGCEEGGGECSADYREGMTVTVLASPGEHKVVQWTGCNPVGGEPNKCEVEVPAEDAAVQAEFVDAPKGTLTVEPDGEGSVDAEEPPAPSAGEIAGCEEGGGECSAEYFQGETVTLVATPGEHKETAWTGCDEEPSANECEVEVDSAEVTVEVEFATITHEVDVEVEGPGAVDADTGPVTGCEEAAGTCSGLYEEGTTVTLTATPAEHAEFVKWEGCDEEPSASECEVEIDGDRAVEAVFAFITYGLTVEPTGTGGGTVAGTGINCSGPPPGGECEAEYVEGTTVTLTATPDGESTFDGWTGCDAEPSATECEVTMSEAKQVEAEFTAKPEFELTVDVTGDGEVDADQGAIFECAESSGICADSYMEGTVVTLVPFPGAGSEFVEWIGCDEVFGNECDMTVDEAKSVEAVFGLIDHSFTVNAAGSGSGSVSCDGGACESTYPHGTEVTLEASANAGSTFVGWSGGGCSGSGNCTLVVEADTTVTANFSADEDNGGGGDDGGGSAPPPSSPPPPPTCLTDAALCNPGLLIANPAAQVKGNKALLKVRCRGEAGARCRGVLNLIAKVKVGNGARSSKKRVRNIVIGKTRYNLPTNSAVRVLRAKLTAKGRKLVRKAGKRGLKVKLTGKGVRNRVVKLKQQGGGKKRDRRRAGR